MKPKYKIGDKVKVINYGHLVYEKGKVIDICSEVVGQEGIIQTITHSHGDVKKYSYSIDGIQGKRAWYNENQLEIINKNPNNL